MTEVKLRRFSGPGGEYGLALNPEFLPHLEGSEQSDRSERKFGIRITKEDLFLLDSLAKQARTTRSALINTLIHEILLGELMSIKDLDAQVLLAQSADNDAKYDPLEQSWLQDVLASDLRALARNVIEHGQTEEFQLLPIQEQALHEAADEEERLRIMGHSDLFVTISRHLKGSQQ